MENTMKSEAAKAIWELKRGNPRNIESIIRFLSKDEYSFGTGYVKEYAWRVLRRAKLTERQRERLRSVALNHLRKRMRREFWYMCRFICCIADKPFKSRVEQLTASKDELIRKRAVLLNAYLESPEKGERLRVEFWRECLSSKNYSRFYRLIEASHAQR